MKLKEESEKADLKLNIKKTKSMGSSPITSWQIEWEKVEAVTEFIFLGSKITADSDRSHEIKKTLTPWIENYGISSQNTEKQRHHFSDKSPYSQNYAFSSHHIQMSELGHKED